MPAQDADHERSEHNRFHVRILAVKANRSISHSLRCADILDLDGTQLADRMNGHRQRAARAAWKSSSISARMVMSLSRIIYTIGMRGVWDDPSTRVKALILVMWQTRRLNELMVEDHSD